MNHQQEVMYLLWVAGVRTDTQAQRYGLNCHRQAIAQVDRSCSMGGGARSMIAVGIHRLAAASLGKIRG